MLTDKLALVSLGLLLIGCDGRDPTAPPADTRLLSPEFNEAGVIHRASVGSYDIVPPGEDANFSLIAVQRSNGTVQGEYTDRFARGGGFHATVTCLHVVGKDAWISGVLTAPKEARGLNVITRVQDNGTSENDPPDQISFSFIDVLPEEVDCRLMLDLPLFPLGGGEVKVD